MHNSTHWPPRGPLHGVRRVLTGALRVERETPGGNRITQSRAGVEQGVRSRDAQLGHVRRTLDAWGSPDEPLVECGELVYGQGHLFGAIQ